MFKTRQTILASRPAAMVLALTLGAALTAPALLLPRASVASNPPLACAEANHNGCTELSPTPPEDTTAVPPNIVLMLDDSGSMAWDYMPDWEYLSDTSLYGVRNSAINYVYYDPGKVYAPPPKADGTFYPDSPGLTNAYTNGFTNTSPVNITTYSGGGNGHSFRYWEYLPTTEISYTDHDYGPAVWGGASAGGCPSGYSLDPSDSSQCIRDPVAPTEIWRCNSGDYGPVSHAGDPHACRQTIWVEGHYSYVWYTATDGGPQCPGGSSLWADGLCHYSPKPVIAPTPDHWICTSGGSTNASAPPPPSAPPECTSTTGSRTWVYAFTYVVGSPTQANEHFVIPLGPNAPADGWCAHLYPGTSPNVWNGYHMDNCVDANDSSGVAAPTTNPDGTPALAQDGTHLTAGQNVANWFSYYRTRMLMAKSGLMAAFSNLDPTYRFGFASINGNGKSKIPGTPAYFTFDDSSSNGGDVSNELAVVQPFGLGSDSSSQRTKFWTWIANESPNNGTPLRKALQAVGQYYQTSQPWSTMPGDPGYTSGSTTKFACRASYTILTTDGFWNGSSPSGIGYAAGAVGPDNSPVPAGNITQYKPLPPFSGGGVGGNTPSLADVATYYWENDLSGMPNEVAASTSDPASWQHMTTFTIGLGFTPAGIQPASTSIPQILAWAQGGNPPPGVAADGTGFSWPTPSSDSLFNIADLAHAAVNGHGDFFNVKKPEDLANALTITFSDIAARAVKPTPASVNASVLSQGALSFNTGYSTKDWTGAIEGVTLKTDGTVDQALWLDGSDANQPSLTSKLDAAYHSPTGYANRTVYTDSYTVSGGAGTFASFQFDAANQAKLDAIETAGLGGNSDCTGSGDTLCTRIDYVLGDSTYEGGIYRARSSILGAILRSEPVYVAGATGNYYDSWPTLGGLAPIETQTGAQTYDAFVIQQSTRPGMVYVGANDGMLHAFQAPVPKCTGTIDASGNCSLYTFASGTDAGAEAWAFVPRAVYANLGNLTTAADFQFRPTVDATPVRRDVFFSSDDQWHTILAGGVGLGGRGVYALDITDPTTFSALWEFDSDMVAPTGCFASYGTCKATDLGYTVSQPNVGRLAVSNGTVSGEWVVLVPNGYFPDCTTPDTPTNDQTNCQAIAADAPKDSSGNPYSALFVLDAQTGKMIAELKTPTGLGVTSFGLATPVMGDYDSDQVDDVAFAGDVQGNLWRFDLSDPDPANWKVTLVYKGLADASGQQGLQPITTMPRLFPDPVTNRFMVVFGTGKFLGLGDNSDATTQAMIGVRDDGNTYSQPGAGSTGPTLTQQYLHEELEPAMLPDGVTPNPLAGASLRCVTGSSANDCSASATAANPVPSSSGGWYINLYTTTSDDVTQNDAGERVVVNPGAIFASNTVIFETLITGSQSSDACNPTTVGAIMALNASTGAPAGVSSLGAWPTAGARISNARTSGSLPVVSALGGGKAYLPGATLAPAGTSPISVDAPIWRRRSWQEIHQ